MSACAQSAMQRKPTAAHKHGTSALRRSSVKGECECAECKKRKGVLQRAAVNEYGGDLIANVLHPPQERPSGWSVRKSEEVSQGPLGEYTSADVDELAAVMLGEDRRSEEGRIAVAWVAIGRALKNYNNYGTSLHSQLSKKVKRKGKWVRQFMGFTDKTVGFLSDPKMKSEVDKARILAESILSGSVTNPVGNRLEFRSEKTTTLDDKVDYIKFGGNIFFLRIDKSKKHKKVVPKKQILQPGVENKPLIEEIQDWDNNPEEHIAGLEAGGLLQRSAAGEQAPEQVPDIVHDVLRSSGQPLDRGTREFMEERFNHDFSAVRVHSGGKAALSAQAVKARAYTVGTHVVIGEGGGNLKSNRATRLLAHELTHVVQDGARAIDEPIRIINDSEEEVAANRMSSEIFLDKKSDIKVKKSSSGLKRYPTNEPAEPDETCHQGSGLTPQLMGQLVHAAIQADLEPRGIYPDSIPNVLEKLNRPKTDYIVERQNNDSTEAVNFRYPKLPDLVGFWRADQAAAKRIDFPKNYNGKEVMYVAELGEIKPDSYSFGKKNHKKAIDQINGYFEKWRAAFPDVPVVPLQTVTGGMLPGKFTGKPITYINVGNGLIIYKCLPLEREPSLVVDWLRERSGERSAKKKVTNAELSALIPIPIPVSDGVRSRGQPKRSERNVGGKLPAPAVDLPKAARVALAVFILENMTLRGQIDQIKAVAKFFSEPRNLAIVGLGLTIVSFGPEALLVALSLPVTWPALALAAVIIATVKASNTQENSTAIAAPPMA